MNAFCFSAFLLLIACGSSDGAIFTGSVIAEAGGTAAEIGGEFPGPSSAAGTYGQSGSSGGSAAGAPTVAGSGGIDARAGAGGMDPTPAGGAGGIGGTPSDPPGGAAGAPPTAGAGGSCSPRTWDAACAGRACGSVPDGCGGELHCGSCAGLTECTDAGQCATTCHSLGLECGEHPVQGLSCGDCPDGQQCGAVSVGHCSTCAEINQAGVCPAAYPHLWTSCGAAPVAACRKPYDQDPSWWCCP